MAKGKQRKVETEEQIEVEGEKRKRQFCDYVFEEHREGERPIELGLVMNYPQEAAKVKEWIEAHKEELGIEGTVRIAKKIYA